jgi:prepilin-type N-terminal cleavage/methylation domain-containing protein
MKRGMALLELLLAMAVLTLLLSIIGALVAQAHRIYTHAEQALFDIETAQRCLEEIKRDLRSASSVEISGDFLKIRHAQGEVVYLFDPTEGSVLRGDRDFTEAFGSLRFTRSGAAIEIESTLRKRDPDSGFEPVWITAVFCPCLR